MPTIEGDPQRSLQMKECQESRYASMQDIQIADLSMVRLEYIQWHGAMQIKFSNTNERVARKDLGDKWNL